MKTVLQPRLEEIKKKMSGELDNSETFKQKKSVPKSEIIWFDKMEIILDIFLEMRSENPDHEYIKTFWNYVMTEVPVGSGGDRAILGWVSILQPVDGKFMISLENNNTVFTKEQFYKFTDEDKKIYSAVLGKITIRLLIETPFTFQDLDGPEKPMEFVAGVYKHPSYDKAKDGIRPTYVFYVRDASKKKKIITK